MARHTITFTETQDKIIDDLMNICQLKRSEVIADGIMLLSWAVAEATKGNQIGAIDATANLYKQVQTPALLAASRLAAERSEPPALRSKRRLESS